MIALEVRYKNGEQKGDQLQQEYFAKKRKGIQDFALMQKSREQEALERKLTNSILNPPEPQLF